MRLERERDDAVGVRDEQLCRAGPQEARLAFRHPLLQRGFDQRGSRRGGDLRHAARDHAVELADRGGRDAGAHTDVMQPCQLELAVAVTGDARF
jgi:hypothetical protein